MLSVGQQPTTVLYSSSLLVQEGVSFCLEGIIFSQSIMRELFHVLNENPRVLYFILLMGLCVILAAGWNLFQSFWVHQQTLEKMRDLNVNGKQTGIYCSKVHVGHDGTTVEYNLLPKEGGTAATSPVDPGSVTPNSPLEQFAILPLNLENFSFSFTNPSLFMLLTLSLVLLLVHFVTKNGGENETGGKV